MARQARQLSASGFYHVVFRGINRQHIFEEVSDYQYFQQKLFELKTEMLFEIHAYCLMSNHVHLLVKENRLGDISQFMKRLLTKYAMYFNRKYHRSGALIANRYKSVPVEVDEYFLPLIRYIHQNPVKAGLVHVPEQYSYSSYREYLEGGKMARTDFVVSMMGKSDFINFHRVIDDRESFEVTGKAKLSDDEVRRRMLTYTGGKQPHEIGALPKAERDALIRKIKDIEGFSVRQIERITGISRGIIDKC